MWADMREIVQKNISFLKDCKENIYISKNFKTVEASDNGPDEFKDIVIKTELLETDIIPMEQANETDTFEMEEPPITEHMIIKSEFTNAGLNSRKEDIAIKEEPTEDIVIKEEPTEDMLTPGESTEDIVINEVANTAINFTTKESIKVEDFVIREVNLEAEAISNKSAEDSKDIVIKTEVTEANDDDDINGSYIATVKQESIHSDDVENNLSFDYDSGQWAAAVLDKLQNCNSNICLKNLYTKKENYYICLKCTNSEKFNCTSAIKSHIRSEHFGITYQCEICNKVYKTKNGLVYHSRSSHGEEVSQAMIIENKFVKCEQEEKSKNGVIKNSKLERTMVTKSGERMAYANIYKKLGFRHYICRKCKIPKKYSTRIAVVRHIRIDHFRIKFKCIECTNEYRNKDALRTHLKEKHKIDIHKLNKGDVIVQSIADSSTESESEVGVSQMENDENHCSDDETMEDVQERTADDIKLATKIKFCGESYKRLDDHEFICLKCEEGSSKVFRHRKTVIDHIRYDHFGIRYKCTKCSKDSKDKGGLTKHLKREHQIDIHKLKLREYCYDSTECEKVLPD